MIQEKKKMKTKRRVFVTIIILIVSLFLLNLLLKNKLEKYLRNELGQLISAKTDGFYDLNFDKLAINFFSGELQIQGVSLIPDSAIFKQWSEIDSLPPTYFRVQINLIEFKGINLTWRLNYKKLHFNSFEVKTPDVQMYKSKHASRSHNTIGENTHRKTLYELIYPHINVLSVKELNLKNANISSTVESVDEPINYALKNVSFSAQNFLLDQYSQEKGKLLFCDNFEFVTNQPQDLLTNNIFLLTLDSFKLSTKDSLIYIQNINLIPQETLWKDKKQKPNSYVSAQCKTLDIAGVSFSRENTLNNLTARTFNLDSSSVRYYNHKNDSIQQAQLLNKDSIIQSLSLYELISPILDRVAIDSIKINKTKLQYSTETTSALDVYQFGNFDCCAIDFLIDSLPQKDEGVWYSQNVLLNATAIEAQLVSQNYQFAVEQMDLDVKKGRLDLKNLHLTPLSKQIKKDYIEGSINAISLNGLVYKNGLTIQTLSIEHPDVQYFKKTPYTKTNKESNDQINLENVLNPLLSFISIKETTFNHACVALHNNYEEKPITYQLNNFNLSISDILINKATIKKDIPHINYGNIKLSFTNFDNYLKDKTYRLIIQKGELLTSKGIIRLEDLSLIPQKEANREPFVPTIQFSTPLLYIEGLKYTLPNLNQQISLDSLMLSQLQFKRREADNSHLLLEMDQLYITNLSTDTSHQLKIKKQDLPQALFCTLNKLKHPIIASKLNIQGASLNYQRSLGNETYQHHKINQTNLSVDSLVINKPQQSIDFQNLSFDTKALECPVLDDFYRLKIGDIAFKNNDLQANNIHLVSVYPKMEFSYKQPNHKTWFDVYIGNLGLKGVDIPAFLEDKTIRLDGMQLNNSTLQNFKNQKISLPKSIKPMIYSALQNAPFKIDIRNVAVNNFSVIYEELAAKGTSPGILSITDMNGTFSQLTNIVSTPDQYNTLEANGKMMGSGYFSATWKLPVDSLNDLFLLNAQMHSFNLSELNKLITPLSPVKIVTGEVQSMTFCTEASSLKANIEMLLLYKDLKISLLKDKDGAVHTEKLLSDLANLIIKHSNINKKESTHSLPSGVHLTVQRDPYHSTFNYIWQILRPSLIESIGISQREQELAEESINFITKIKRFFRKRDKKER